VSSPTQTAITLSWNASTDNVAVTGYGRYRNGSLVSSGTGTSFAFTGLSCGTSYTLAVDAYDAAGNRSGKGQLTASTSACPADSTPPSVPGNFAASSATQTSITLTWTASTDNVGVSGYTAYNGTTGLGNTSATTFNVSGLSCGTSYSLGVDAYDAAGNRSAKAVLSTSTAPCPDTVAPTAPTNLVANANTTSSITLAWTASLDNVGVAGYGVYNGATNVGTATVATFTVTGLSCGTGYTLAVDAFDAAGNRSGKAQISASTASCAPPPPPPSGSGVANVWVDGSGGSCLRVGVAAGYVDAQACGSLDAAYQKASAGDLVLVKGGSYPDQTINNRSGLGAVTIRPAAGESVTINGCLSVLSQNLLLEGGGTSDVNEPDRITVTGAGGDCGIDVKASNVTFEDVHTRNTWWFDGLSNVTFRDGEIGPADLGSPALCADIFGTDRVTNGVLEFSLIHGVKPPTACGGAHTDALDYNLVNGVIRGNRIWDCGAQCVFTGDPSSTLIENNMIEETNSCGDCGGPLELSLMGTNTVRYNTVEGGDGYGRDPDRPGTANVYGNVFLGGAYSCAGGGAVSVSYDHNVFPPGSKGCGTNSKICTPRLADGNLWTSTDRQADYHLAATDTCALGAGANTYPALDLDQQPRPQNGTTPDAGADER
jgi:chitodextrinase